MMERDSVPELLETLRHGPVGVATPEEVEAERQMLMPWLEEQVALLPLESRRYAAARQRRRSLVFGASALLAAAAGVLLVWQWQAGQAEASGVAQLPPPPDNYATLISGRLLSGAVEILPGSRLGEASLVRSSSEDPAVLQGSSGYVAQLGSAGELALGGPGAEPSRQELRLIRGEVQLTVPPLAAGTTLSVLTEDARVTVRGTKFLVALQEDAGVVRTCVRVTEGSVEVHRRGVASELLAMGEKSGCEPAAQSKSESTRAAPGGSERAAVRPLRQPSPASSSTLAQENELLAAALSAEQSGDRAQASRQLKTLLRRYPQSSLANEARAVLQRLSQEPRTMAD